jgi:hypothetical protein
MQHGEFYVALWPYIILNSEIKNQLNPITSVPKMYVVLVSTEEKER